MDVTLKPFNFAQAAARAGLGVNGMPLAGKPGAAAGAGAVQGPGFQQALSQALRSVSDTQNQSSEMQRQVQMGNPTVSLEETMVAMQKAQIGFQATLQVRNKLVSAYSEIMNMTV
ncbi:MAG: flagellar hook-basal body complex protein FliE [Rhizobacter sp.]|jgi:flagellar hook-basal body complex protein FliE